MEQQEEEVFFKKNVPYRVGVRMELKDSEGILLDDTNPYVAVPKKNLRKFLQANKTGIDRGLIIEIDEPPLETISNNSLTDDQAAELVKNYHTLKKKLPEITSDVTILKLLQAAKATKRAEGTVKLITERYEEISPDAMQSVS